MIDYSRLQGLEDEGLVYLETVAKGESLMTVELNVKAERGWVVWIIYR